MRTKLVSLKAPLREGSRREEESVLGGAERKGFVVFTWRFLEAGMEFRGVGWARHLVEGVSGLRMSDEFLKGEGLREG